MAVLERKLRQRSGKYERAKVDCAPQLEGRSPQLCGLVALGRNLDRLSILSLLSLIYYQVNFSYIPCQKESSPVKTRKGTAS